MVDLALPDDVLGFPGAPFAQAQLTAAGDLVRRECGWHIAPSETDTVTLDSDGSAIQWLPSRYVTAVTVVNDMSSGAPVDITSSVKWRQDGRIYMPYGFPSGIGVLQVTFTHGYDACPPDLARVVAGLAAQSPGSAGIKSASLGSGQVTFVDTARALQPDSPAWNYALPDMS